MSPIKPKDVCGEENSCPAYPNVRLLLGIISA